MGQSYRFNTLALHAGVTIDETNSRGVPLYRTSSYVFKSTQHAANLFGLKELGNIYTRLMNPTHDVLEKRMAALEGGAASLALASGTSAIFYSVINVCGLGDEVVSANNLYGGTYTMFDQILPELGIKVKFVDPLKPENFEKAINDRTRMLFMETIGNPVLELVQDLDDVVDVRRAFVLATDHRENGVDHALDWRPVIHEVGELSEERVAAIAERYHVQVLLFGNAEVAGNRRPGLRFAPPWIRTLTKRSRCGPCWLPWRCWRSWRCWCSVAASG